MTYKIAYSTSLGCIFEGKSEEVLTSDMAVPYRGKIDLIFTSPPFLLNHKKRYGNYQGQQYIDWLAEFAPIFRSLLKPKGSIVIELGNSWEPRRPVMSTLALRALLAFLDRGKFVLCQQFIWNNPAKLPTPAQWVNIERIRVKDAFTHIWWMAMDDRPQANNKKVLIDYSPSMIRLLRTKNYNSGRRPSQHNIGEKSFLKNNHGAIPSNVLTYANTHASTDYQRYCRKHELTPHPARMPSDLATLHCKNGNWAKGN